jgi:hypothetical protein
MKKTLFALALLGTLFSTQSCDKDDESSCDGSRKGTLEAPNGLDSCGLVVKFSDGTYVTPLNLIDFDLNAEVGQTVHITFDTFLVAYPCAVGPTVRITCLD